ncbi:uncharacterized protein LOC119770154 [Culex quinquefasciatus]|uniref:uncharacterized protein LOC119770154 n=1 Tax=Culex quinquefasciatus TaxID=7176 RepID=UPI0018E2E6E9|nr:uncharacterized protein LOC119770154 [Culex quinquefasciatus]
MDIVTRCYDEYNTFQNLIHALPLSDNLRTEHEEKYVEFESLYTDTAVRLSTLIERATKPVPAPVPNASAVALRQAERLNLPALQVPLPTFDGSYEKWYSFKAMFTTIMNRYQHEEPALKLYHLRRCLVDKAEGIIDQEIIDNNDYDAAWLLLKQQYEDKHIIVDKHVDNLFNLPRISQESATNMRKMINVCTKNVEVLKKQNLLAVWLGEQMLVNLIAAKMDKKLRVAWEARQKKDVLSTYDATMEFLQEQCRIYEKFDTKPAMESAKPKAVARSHTLVTSETKSELKCAVCKANHELWKCDAFKQKSVSDKYEVLKKCGACFNCLARGHRTRACSSRTCQECGRKHHTLLHTEDTSSQTSSSATSTKPAEVTTPVVKSGNQVTSTPAGTSTTLCASAVIADKQTLLSTAVVLVDGVGSTPYPCRVLLDSASQMNFVTDRFANLLSLRTTRADFTVSGLNGNKTRTTDKSRLGDFSASLDLLVTPDHR